MKAHACRPSIWVTAAVNVKCFTGPEPGASTRSATDVNGCPGAAGATLTASGMPFNAADVATNVMATATSPDGALPTPINHIWRSAQRAGQTIRDTSSTLAMISSRLQITSDRPICSGIPALGPTGRPIVLDTNHIAASPTLNASMAVASPRVGRAKSSTARTICAQPTARKNTPNGRYSRRCSGATARWINAAASVSSAAEYTRTPPMVRRRSRMELRLDMRLSLRTWPCDRRPSAR